MEIRPSYLIEGSGKQVDRIVRTDPNGTTHIDWPSDTEGSDWVKVSVPLLRQMNDTHNALVHQVAVLNGLLDSKTTIEHVGFPETNRQLNSLRDGIPVVTSKEAA